MAAGVGMGMGGGEASSRNSSISKIDFFVTGKYFCL